MILQSTVDWSSGVTNAWNDIAEFVPRLVAFLLILLVGWLVAKLLAKATDAILERVGFDRVVERGGVRAALSRSRYDASDLVAKLVYYTVLLIALVYAFNVFGPNPVSELLSDVIGWLPRLVVAILIIVIASAIAKAVKDILSAALGSLSFGNLVATIAMRTLCKVEFDPSGKLVVSGVGGIEKGSKSRQSIKPIEMDGDVFADANKIEVSCSDLVEALAVPTSDTVSIGLSSPSAGATGSILVIDQVKDPTWRHAMIRCTEAV